MILDYLAIIIHRHSMIVFSKIIKFNKTRDCVSFFENENDVVDAIKKSQYITDKNQIINTIYYEDQMINIFKLIEQ